MRFLIAALLFVISVTLLLTGLAQRTIWAPPSQISQAIQLESAKSLVLIPNSVLNAHRGNPTVYVHGSGATFLATGRESDVSAWIGSSSFDTVTLNKKQLIQESKEGVPNIDSPIGSDLWRTEVNSVVSARLKVDKNNEGAVLVASDGIKPTAGSISIVWPVPFDLFWSNLLMISGGVILLSAIILNTLAYRNMRRSRGPRRKTPTPPKPPRYRVKAAKGNAPVRGRRAAGRAFIAVPVVISVLLATTSCAPAPTPTASPTPAPSGQLLPPAALLQSQIDRIVKNVAEVSSNADVASDKKVLTSRFAGPALQQRTAYYVIRSRSTKLPALPPILGEPISFSLPAATDAWPRTAMVVTDNPSDSQPPQMLVLQQETPRSKYMLWYNIALMPGTKIPEVPGTEVGAIPVDPNSLFLKVAPNTLAAVYGDVINNGASSLSYGLFDVAKDEFYNQVSADQANKVANVAGKISFSHALGDKNVLSLATRTAGALVAVYMTDTYTIKPKNRRSAIAVTGNEKIMLGADGSTRGIKSVYGDMLLFYVPAVSDETGIKLLGVTQGLISVRSL